MTKPIEGWVAWSRTFGISADSLTLIGGQQVEDPISYCLRKICNALNLPSKSMHKLSQAGWNIRPVRITFTDESDEETVRSFQITFTDEHVINEKADLGMAFVAGAAWRKDDEIADAIRKEREWFWERLIETGFVCRSELHYKEKIFGEEK